MPDHKLKCKACKQRHLPPTGKKCQLVNEKTLNPELLRDAAVSSGATESQMTPGESTDGQLVQMQILEQLKRVTDRLDQVDCSINTPLDTQSRVKYRQFLRKC